MSTTEHRPRRRLARRPKRADARRNYDKVVAAAREAFAERGASTSLEEIARRAEVGIGTLYRNFPNRQALLEAVYVDEVESLCRSAGELEGLAAVGRVRRPGCTGSSATWRPSRPSPRSCSSTSTATHRCSRAAAPRSSPPASRCSSGRRRRKPSAPTRTSPRSSRWSAGSPKIPGAEPEQIEHILDIALDGLRYRPTGP